MPEELHNDSRNLATLSGIQRREEIEKSGSEKTIATNTFTLFFRKRKGKMPGRQMSLKSMSHHAAGIGTCTQSGMINPRHSSSEMHLGKFLNHTEFQSWIVNLRTEVCSKAKNPTHALQWIKEIEAAKALDDLNTPKSTTGKAV